ncbi:MAG: hypothetical protein IIC10_00280 [Proteobacteria bacterium]|nr:hypothetical protein [Pseudomonadota bacterium]
MPMAVLPPDPLFQSTDLLDITLVAPFDRIDRDRDKEQEYEGSLSYTDANGQEVVLDITLEVRGNDRLKKENCRYSQLWVDFKRRQTAGTQNESQPVAQQQARLDPEIGSKMGDGQ